MPKIFCFNLRIVLIQTSDKLIVTQNHNLLASLKDRLAWISGWLKYSCDGRVLSNGHLRFAVVFAAYCVRFISSKYWYFILTTTLPFNFLLHKRMPHLAVGCTIRIRLYFTTNKYFFRTLKIPKMQGYISKIIRKCAIETYFITRSPTFKTNLIFICTRRNFGIRKFITNLHCKSAFIHMKPCWRYCCEIFQALWTSRKLEKHLMLKC